jgi:hypothetical protein
MYDFSLRYSSKTQKLISRKFIRYDPEKVMNITKSTLDKLTPGLFEKAVPFNDPEL